MLGLIFIEITRDPLNDLRVVNFLYLFENTWQPAKSCALSKVSEVDRVRGKFLAGSSGYRPLF